MLSRSLLSRKLGSGQMTRAEVHTWCPCLVRWEMEGKIGLLSLHCVSCVMLPCILIPNMHVNALPNNLVQRLWGRGGEGGQGLEVAAEHFRENSAQKVLSMRYSAKDTQQKVFLYLVLSIFCCVLCAEYLLLGIFY